MSSLFYDHLVDWPAAEAKIRELVQREEEHHELTKVLDQITHHAVFAIIFEVLPEDVHEHFVKAVKEAPHSLEHLQRLQLYDVEVEKRIQQAATEAHQKFFDAIHGPVVK
jgi:hypothetical protein